VLAELKRRQAARTRAAKGKTAATDPDKYKREVCSPLVPGARSICH